MDLCFNILKINILPLITEVRHTGSTFVIPSIFFVIPSGAEGSVNFFYRFLHSLRSVEMKEKIPFGLNDRKNPVLSK